MNRRHFISGLAGALCGFAVLPAATTYTRLWKAVAVPRINPAWVNAPYAVVMFLGVPRIEPEVWYERNPWKDFLLGKAMRYSFDCERNLWTRHDEPRLRPA